MNDPLVPPPGRTGARELSSGGRCPRRSAACAGWPGEPAGLPRCLPGRPRPTRGSKLGTRRSPPATGAGTTLTMSSILLRNLAKLLKPYALSSKFDESTRRKVAFPFPPRMPSGLSRTTSPQLRTHLAYALRAGGFHRGRERLVSQEAVAQGREVLAHCAVRRNADHGLPVAPKFRVGRQMRAGSGEIQSVPSFQTIRRAQRVTCGQRRRRRNEVDSVDCDGGRRVCRSDAAVSEFAGESGRPSRLPDGRLGPAGVAMCRVGRR